MDISEIIGQGKCYVPPFKYNRYGRVTDANDAELLNIDNFTRLLQHFPKHETFGTTVLAEHICQLLNERWKDEIQKETVGD